MLQINRSYTAGSTKYRYGFNGKEMDSSINGNGVDYDYGARIYDARVAKFLSVDPLFQSYPWYTPYQFSGNMPIAAIDLDGLEQRVVVYYKSNQGNPYKVIIYKMTNKDNEAIDLQIQAVVNQHRAGTNIAKGNALVFDVYNEGAKNEQVVLVNSRNTTNSQLTKQESKIDKENAVQFDENARPDKFQYFGIADADNPKYASLAQDKSETNAYSAQKRLPYYKAYTYDYSPRASDNGTADAPIESTTAALANSINSAKKDFSKSYADAKNISVSVSLSGPATANDRMKAAQAYLQKQGMKVTITVNNNYHTPFNGAPQNSHENFEHTVTIQGQHQ